MTSILWHVILRDKIMRAGSSSSALTDSQDKGTPPHRSDTEVQADDLLNLYLEEITKQAVLYTGAFFLCYAPIVVLNAILLFDLPVSTTFLASLHFLVALFYPLNGLFTILIYTRPAVGHLRRGNPEYSWLSAFVLVLKAGSEVQVLKVSLMGENMCIR